MSLATQNRKLDRDFITDPVNPGKFRMNSYRKGQVRKPVSSPVPKSAITPLAQELTAGAFARQLTRQAPQLECQATRPLKKSSDGKL
jgi:hypothetical protein